MAKPVFLSVLFAGLVALAISTLMAPGPTNARPEAATDALFRDALESTRAEVASLRTEVERLGRPRPGAPAAPSAVPERVERVCDPHCEVLQREIVRLSDRLAALESASALRGGAASALARAGKRPWGPEQATGAPDTPQSGDHPSAWASATPDGANEWLFLEFPNAVVPSEIRVHESFHPGALNQVSVFDSAGKEVFLWAGADPTPYGADQGISAVPCSTKVRTRTVKLYFNSLIREFRG